MGLRFFDIDAGDFPFDEPESERFMDFCLLFLLFGGVIVGAFGVIGEAGAPPERATVCISGDTGS